MSSRESLRGARASLLARAHLDPADIAAPSNRPGIGAIDDARTVAATYADRAIATSAGAGSRRLPRLALALLERDSLIRRQDAGRPP